MGRKLTAALGLVATLVGGCASPTDPTADCFALLAGAQACDFQPLAGVEGVRP